MGLNVKVSLWLIIVIYHAAMNFESLVYKAFLSFVFTANTYVYAEQKYNPYSRQWETVSPDTELIYNPLSRQWNYAPKDSSPTYNPYERSWDLAPDDYQQKYNPYENSWGTTDPDSRPQYNPYEGSWEYPRWRKVCCRPRLCENSITYIM